MMKFRCGLAGSRVAWVVVAWGGLLLTGDIARSQDAPDLEAKLRGQIEILPEAQLDAEDLVEVQVQLREIVQGARQILLRQVPGVEKVPEVEKKPEEPVPASDSPPADAADEPAPRAPAVPLPPRFMRLNLMDGTIVSGDLSVSEIQVETEFGTLTIPIASIVKFTPGLESHPKLADELQALIEALGGDDYKNREAAHKQLLGMGPKIRPILEGYRNDENAERKKHVDQILKELEEQEGDEDELEGSAADTRLVPYDTVVTPKFTVVGRISPEQFEIKSKFGTLSVSLSDVQSGERGGEGKEPVQKRLSVEGTHLTQRAFKQAGIRVERGDRVTISAEGQIIMSPWGNNAICGPDGGANYGWYVQNQIPGGALVAKIGDSGEVFKVGSKHTFVAKKSGTLQFAIAMNPSYAGEGYFFPGQYSVRVRVDPQ